MIKDFSELTIEDFHLFPIWQPVDDFEDGETKVETFSGNTLDVEEIYFISSLFTLSDNSTKTGFIRFSNGRVRAVFIWDERGKFYSLSAKTQTYSEKEQAEFCNENNKTLGATFPITYRFAIDINLTGRVY